MSLVKPFLDAKVIARLSGIPLDARRPMTGSVSGRHRSSMKGSSLEFAQYRKYVPGDDTRRLDWRVWGRSDRCYIKEFEADTNLRLCMVIDSSGSMGYGPNGTLDVDLQKITYARKLAGTLAWLAAKQGDAVGFYDAGSASTRSIPARRGARHLKVVLDQLESIQPMGETALVSTLHTVAERVPRRSLVVVISDLFVKSEPLANCFQHLRYRKHDVAVFHLLDMSELEFAFGQPMKFLDLEGGAAMLADPTIIRDAYLQSVSSYLREIDEMVRHSEIDYRRTDMTEAYGDLLAQFLNARRSRTR